MTPHAPSPAAAAGSHVLYPLGGRPSLPAYGRALWARRDFVLALPMSQLRSRNADTVLGSAWHLLNPLVLAATYFFVFGVLLEARRGVDNFVGFLVIGLFVFHYTQKCVTRGAAAMVSNDRMIRSLNLPRAVYPVAGVLSETLSHLPAVALLFALMGATGEEPHASWLLVVPLLVVQAAFSLGLALWAARLTFHFRDVQNLLPFVLRLWLYVSGIFFTVDRLPEGWVRAVFENNPAQVFLSLNRDALLHGSTDGGEWALVLLWSSALLVTGIAYFWAGEDEYGRA